MSPSAVAHGLFRHRGEIRLLRDTDTGRWRGPLGPLGGDLAADSAVVCDLLGVDSTAVTLARQGAPFPVDDTALGRCRVHPFLFDCDHRDLSPGGHGRADWVSPTAIADRETVSFLRESYDRVRPRVETVATDTEHGSTYLSMRALELLRDEATVATRGSGQRGPTDDAPDSTEAENGSVEAVARELLAARPSMTAVENRINRVMASATDPAAVGPVAHEAIDRAARVDHEAATAAASRLGTDVATLSRSGTVRQTLALADPETVLVAESRPGGEGTAVADTLARRTADTTVTLTTDAGLPAALAAVDVDTLVVGADAVLADGRVVNKVGTRSATLAATHEGVDTVVVAASDKISPDTDRSTEEREPGELYQGDAPVRVRNPTFDVTPPAAVDTVVTERGALDTRDVEGIAAEHRALRDWTL